jgi:aldose 1-epimerase
MTPSDILILAGRRSDWRVHLVPSRGAAAVTINARRGGVWYPVAHPTGPQTLHDDLRLRYSNYVLLPYSNRIAYGRLRATSAGHSLHKLPVNWPGLTHPIHGLGWLQPWRVTQWHGRQARLRLDWPGGDAWPWPLLGEQRLRLLGRNILQMDLRLTNTGAETMPAGLGWHPSFMADAGATLRTQARWIQTAGPDGIPNGLQRPPLALAEGRATSLQSLPHLDNCFGGWSGKAELHWPERQGLRVRLQALGVLRRCCVIYTPPDEDFFSVEPVSHANNALAQNPRRAAALGQRWLAPGQTLSGGMRWVLPGSSD